VSTHHDASWALMAAMSLNVSLWNCSYTENSTVRVPSGSNKKLKVGHCLNYFLKLKLP